MGPERVTIRLGDVLALAGMACLTAGVYLLHGLGTALVVGGICLIVTGFVIALARAAARG